MGLELSMENLPWVIVAVGIGMGGMIMTFGFRKADRKSLMPGYIGGAVMQDWTPTGNIDFHASTESSSPQPLRLWVEERRITESVVGQRVVELRWRLATIDEGKELVVCWNASRAKPPGIAY
jgi:hypothetical protein